VLDGDVITLDASRSDHYVDAGATCDDYLDGNLNRHVKVSGQVVNLGIVGTYQIKYDCKNLADVAASQCLRTVEVRDLTCPTCLMNMGPARIEASFPYFDSGAICTDDLDGPTAVTDVNPVNVESTGTYLVTYRTRDANDNWNDGTPTVNSAGYTCKDPHTYIRTVVVVDTLRPVLALNYNKSGVIQTGRNDDISDTPIQYRNPAGRDHTKFANFGSLMTETANAARAFNPKVLAAASGALGLALLVTAAVRRRMHAQRLPRV
jgi:hypothetical protein